MKGDSTTHTGNPKYRNGYDYLMKVCPKCKGKCHIIYVDDFNGTETILCHTCNGTGKVRMGKK